jgi:diaminopimelate decarboxylase
MKMPKSDNDIRLTDGERYMVKDAPYQHHIRTTVEMKQPQTCVNHKAAAEKRSGRENLDCTGVVGCACARHGCFVPNSMVDLQKGER